MLETAGGLTRWHERTLAPWPLAKSPCRWRGDGVASSGRPSGVQPGAGRHLIPPVQRVETNYSMDAERRAPEATVTHLLKFLFLLFFSPLLDFEHFRHAVGAE